jgi:ZIP family zinc transporter
MNLTLIVFAILPFFSTSLGGLAALRLRHRLHPVMALAAGVLVATALVDLLPEASELISGEGLPLGGGLPLAGAAAMIGFIAFSALEAIVHEQTYEHRHHPSQDPAIPHEHDGHDDDDEPHTASAVALAGPLGLIVHSTLDGVAIGLAFAAGQQLGLIVAFAVLAHDFADGLNVVTLALAGGRGRRYATTLLVIDALAPPFGVVLSTIVPLGGTGLGLLLGGFSGVFIAIGAGHLLPEAQHRQANRSRVLVGLAALGAVAVVAIRSVVG